MSQEEINAIVNRYLKGIEELVALHLVSHIEGDHVRSLVRRCVTELLAADVDLPTIRELLDSLELAHRNGIISDQNCAKVLSVARSHLDFIVFIEEKRRGQAGSGTPHLDSKKYH